MPRFKFIKTAISIVIIIIIAVSAYSALTYPENIINFSVSFTAGIDNKIIQFSQPFTDDKVQVQVAIQSGSALWRAQLLNGSQVIWEHSAVQGDQLSYNSGWIQLPSGTYNFTFGTIGIGSLDAKVTVTSKGGFW
jgi:hypothetical protein